MGGILCVPSRSSVEGSASLDGSPRRKDSLDNGEPYYPDEPSYTGDRPGGIQREASDEDSDMNSTGPGSVRDLLGRLPFKRDAALGSGSLNIVTWNIAAVNNNPFEYWVTHHDPGYNRLMHNVQEFIDSPGERDIEVQEIFTNDMWIELKNEMMAHDMDGLEEVERRWNEEYRNRKIVSGFMKDKGIGSKRLASMPDRITNTINTSDGSIVMRPTVTNGFDGSLSSIDKWWKLWKDFVFRFVVQVYKKDGVSPPQVVCKLIEPILHSKYPAITPEEQVISIPLQIMCLAIFDAILVHMLNTVAPRTWQPLKRSLCDALIRNKSKKNINILSHTYADADVIFIQEAAAAFVEQTMGDDHLARKFMLLKPGVLDGKRDQNSLIFANRERFDEDTAVEVTEEVLSLVEGNWTAAGDLVCFRIEGVSGLERFLLCSFHGDSNGLATLPIMRALHQLASITYTEHTLIVGLDANTYKEASAQRHGVQQFAEWIMSKGMISCWGEDPDPGSSTTCNARTFLQPQLNKAVRLSEQVSKGEQNLKDWIVFFSSQLTASNTTRDNTGRVRYVREMVFPTLVFPSDHAVVSTTLSPTIKGEGSSRMRRSSQADSYLGMDDFSQTRRFTSYSKPGSEMSLVAALTNGSRRKMSLVAGGGSAVDLNSKSAVNMKGSWQRRSDGLTMEAHSTSLPNSPMAGEDDVRVKADEIRKAFREMNGGKVEQQPSQTPGGADSGPSSTPTMSANPSRNSSISGSVNGHGNVNGKSSASPAKMPMHGSEVVWSPTSPSRPGGGLSSPHGDVGTPKGGGKNPILLDAIRSGDVQHGSPVIPFSSVSETIKEGKEDGEEEEGGGGAGKLSAADTTSTTDSSAPTLESNPAAQGGPAA